MSVAIQSNIGNSCDENFLDQCWSPGFDIVLSGELSKKDTASLYIIYHKCI